MKILGVSAGGVGREGNTDRMVKAILDKSGHDVEFVKLADLTYSGCKGCVHLCAGPQVCMLDDDAQPYYQKVKDADAVVIGSPVYFSSMNALATAFIERFFGYRHVDIPIAGKPFVIAVAGSMMVDFAVEQLQRTLGVFFQANVIESVTFQSQIPPCLKCGRHKECEIGGLYMMHGEAAKSMKITPELFNKWEECEETMASVDSAAEKLRNL
jgi:multimeric flavodoxin WrbA